MPVQPRPSRPARRRETAGSQHDAPDIARDRARAPVALRTSGSKPPSTPGPDVRRTYAGTSRSPRSTRPPRRSATPHPPSPTPSPRRAQRHHAPDPRQVPAPVPGRDARTPSDPRRRSGHRSPTPSVNSASAVSVSPANMCPSATGRSNKPRSTQSRSPSSSRCSARAEPAAGRRDLPTLEKTEAEPERAPGSPPRITLAQALVMSPLASRRPDVVLADKVRRHGQTLQIVDTQRRTAVGGRQLDARISPRPTLERATANNSRLAHRSQHLASRSPPPPGSPRPALSQRCHPSRRLLGFRWSRCWGDVRQTSPRPPTTGSAHAKLTEGVRPATRSLDLAGSSDGYAAPRTCATNSSRP